MGPAVGRPGDDGAALAPLFESMLQWSRPDGRMTDTADEDDVARQPTEMGRLLIGRMTLARSRRSS